MKFFINKSDNYNNNNDDINQETHGLWYKKIFRTIVSNIVMTVWDRDGLGLVTKILMISEKVLQFPLPLLVRGTRFRDY